MNLLLLLIFLFYSLSHIKGLSGKLSDVVFILRYMLYNIVKCFTNIKYVLWILHDFVAVTEYTAEEDSRVTIKCEGFVPDKSADERAIFSWYTKFPSDQNIIALYEKNTGRTIFYQDYEDRVYIDYITGHLIFYKVRASDTNFYTCVFSNFKIGEPYERQQKLDVTGKLVNL